MPRTSTTAQQLKEHVFAVNSTRVSLIAVQIGQGRLLEATANIRRAISALQDSADPAEQELYGVTLRFSAQLLSDAGERLIAEIKLRESIEVFERVGDNASVQLAYSLSELACLCAAEGRFSEAHQQIVRAMNLLAASVAEASGIQLQSQFATAHPTIVRALKRYLTALRSRGETARLEEAKRTFDAFDAAVRRTE
ncbi:MAG TPA: hypothetical protein V6D22_13165 [Candidatus Obscuribacterales bacterium]